jgi:hypothetical protein
MYTIKFLHRYYLVSNQIQAPAALSTGKLLSNQLLRNEGVFGSRYIDPHSLDTGISL